MLNKFRTEDKANMANQYQHIKQELNSTLTNTINRSEIATIINPYKEIPKSVTRLTEEVSELKDTQTHLQTKIIDLSQRVNYLTISTERTIT